MKGRIEGIGMIFRKGFNVCVVGWWFFFSEMCWVRDIDSIVSSWSDSGCLRGFIWNLKVGVVWLGSV